ncbi:MAG: class I SAM-dependent methyltransferase [Deltaproteobacteria bacterium]|nr:class I SAM-dependent methyltransferase [Deltaproteobacteria bacterium]
MRKDRDRWESRHNRESPDFDDPDPLLTENRKLLTSGIAVDLASGFGADSLFVAEAGYKVHSLDISFRALSALHGEARQRGLDVSCVVADLDEYALSKAYYDLILVFYFYAKPLMGPIQDCLKRGGLLFYATYNFRHTSVKPEFNPAYLLPPGGLSPFFPKLEIILDEPEAGPDRNVSRFIGRKA